MTDGIYRLLRQAIDERFNGNLTALADALGVPVQSVSKWVYENPSKRSNPWPASCAKIADGLGLDHDYVLELAGHRPPRPAAEWAQARVTAWRQSIHERLEYWIAAVGPQYEEYFWQHLKNEGDSSVAFIRGLGVAVNQVSDGAVNAVVSGHGTGDFEDEDAADGGLTMSYRAARVRLAGLLPIANAALAG